MLVYYFRCYWHLVFAIRCVTDVSNLRKVGQKLWSLSRGIGTTRTDGRTDKHSSDFVSVQCHELHWTDNKITFERTRSLSNVACFKHDNNVCACAVNALILLPVVNLLSLEMDSATSSSYMTGKFYRSTLPFA